MGSSFAYIERDNDLPVRNLITFGLPHMGISDIPPCNLAQNALPADVYSGWA